MQPYATTFRWTLTSGNGEKTVYAKYRDVNVIFSRPECIDRSRPKTGPRRVKRLRYLLNDYIKLGANNNPR